MFITVIALANPTDRENTGAIIIPVANIRAVRQAWDDTDPDPSNHHFVDDMALITWELNPGQTADTYVLHSFTRIEELLGSKNA